MSLVGIRWHIRTAEEGKETDSKTVTDSALRNYGRRNQVMLLLSYRQLYFPFISIFWKILFNPKTWWNYSDIYFIPWHFQSASHALNPKNQQEESGPGENVSGCIYSADQRSYWAFGINYNELTDSYPIPTLKASSIK